jgi:hypothetical protein
MVNNEELIGRLRLKCDGTGEETRFRLSAKWTSPFKSAGGGSVQSTTGSRGVCISASNAGYTMFWGSVKSTSYPLHSPVPPSRDRQNSARRDQLKCDGTRAETRFHLSAKRTSPFKSARASVQSTTGSRGVRIGSSNAGYTMFWGSVKSTSYPLHSSVSPSLPLSCVTVWHHFKLESNSCDTMADNRRQALISTGKMKALHKTTELPQSWRELRTKVVGKQYN